MPTLDELRKNIDRVDEVLVRLLNERARCACEIGRIKKAENVEKADEITRELYSKPSILGRPDPAEPRLLVLDRHRSRHGQ